MCMNGKNVSNEKVGSRQAKTVHSRSFVIRESRVRFYIPDCLLDTKSCVLIVFLCCLRPRASKIRKSLLTNRGVCSIVCVCLSPYSGHGFGTARS